MNEIITLNRNSDFRRAYNKGKYSISPLVVTYVIKNRNKGLRYGITTSKKVGCAVKRNRARRIIKSAFLDLSKDIKPGYDLVFVARAKTPFAKSQNISKDMRKHLKREGLLKWKIR